MFISRKKYSLLVNDAQRGRRDSVACAETIKEYRHMLVTSTGERDFWRGRFQDVDFEFYNYKKERGDIDMTKNLKDVANRIIEMKKILNLTDSQIKRILEISITNEVSTYDVTKVISYIRSSNNQDEITDDVIELANYAIVLNKRGWDNET